ncbi:MAG: M48 family metallopeptidase [Pyrinomonadaceae bacterium]|nr:M48 family metallopeptidase [Phycisphaerales bacterium]
MALFGNRSQRTGSRMGGRLMIGIVIAAISLIGYYARTSTNPVTGKKQHISLSPQQEVAIGLQAAPEMARQFGGLSGNAEGRDAVARVGAKLTKAIPTGAEPYPYQFHLLDDDTTVNAFALPGGQIFITDALFNQLQTEGQLAGVLGHEIGHVIGRHSAERMAKMELTQGLVGAVGVAASGDGSGQSAQAVAAMVGNFLTLKYGRTDELESDELGVRIMATAGYDPHSMIGVMEILKRASGDRGGKPEFSSTHPDPGRRMEEIQKVIDKLWPQGVPQGLQK